MYKLVLHIPLTNCVLARIVRISIPKWSWKTILAFWRFFSLSLFALFWDTITERENNNKFRVECYSYKFTSVIFSINWIFKYQLTIFSLGLFPFKFLDFLNDFIFLHLLLLDLRHDLRNITLFLLQWYGLLFNVWGTNIASVAETTEVWNLCYNTTNMGQKCMCEKLMITVLVLDQWNRWWCWFTQINQSCKHINKD